MRVGKSNLGHNPIWDKRSGHGNGTIGSASKNCKYQVCQYVTPAYADKSEGAIRDDSGRFGTIRDDSGRFGSIRDDSGRYVCII